MNNLKVTTIQAALHWEDKEKNFLMFSEKIDSIPEATDLIVLPEMFTTGFSMKPEKFAEPMSGRTVSWIKNKSSEKNCVITGSFICEEDGKFYNRLIWANPDGSYYTYDKRHLFRMAHEDAHYSAGQNKLIIELKGWKICPLVCYDLRFPVWSRNTPAAQLTKDSTPAYEYDLLIYVANWPEVRSYPWRTLLLARAIENQCYVVGLNRIGDDGNNIYHSGDSAIINAKGAVISHTKPHEESVETVELNYTELQDFRKAFPALLDADSFEIVKD